MNFTKMHGAGNDYVYVNCFDEPFPQDTALLARQVSDRHKGIGGDGLILICPTDQADAQMRMFNADGSESEMCGNGIRCVAKYVYDHGIAPKDHVKIETGLEINPINAPARARNSAAPACPRGAVSGRPGLESWLAGECDTSPESILRGESA